MAIKIGHASIDEVGGIRGPKTGDQTGKEICIRTFYSHPWNVYLECTDKKIAKKAASIMKEICNNSNFGYSQVKRWDGYNSIKKNGGKISKAKGDFDCSSLVITCYILAGIKMSADGATINLKNKLLATGKFKAHTESKYLTSGDYAKVGGIFLKEGSHVAMALEDGPKSTVVKKATAVVKKVTKPASKTTFKAHKVTVTADSLNVRKKASAKSNIVKVYKKGTVVKVTAESNGFYKTKDGFISKKYVK